MECLGPSLANVRRALPRAHFSLSTGLRVGIQSLRAIQAFHQRGFVHRDIKPSNFLLRTAGSTLVVLADYGLARHLTHRRGPPQTGHQRRQFVGTPKYASLRAHEGGQLGRGDDIVSWIFSLLEMLTGTLPWPATRNYDETHLTKKSANVAEFCKTLPYQIEVLYQRAIRYGEDDEPEYDAFAAALGDAMDDAGCDWEQPFDWEALSDAECDSLAGNIRNPDRSLSRKRPRMSSSPGQPDVPVRHQQTLDQNRHHRKMCGESVPATPPCSVL